MNCKSLAFLLLGKHQLGWSHSDGKGGTISYFYSDYYDAITWIVVALVIVWVISSLIIRYRRAQSLKRPRRPVALRPPKNVVKLKREVSAQYLRPGFSGNIHAIGIGLLPGSAQHCIQVFINDLAGELWPGATAASLPADFRGVPLVLIEMPRAALLSATAVTQTPPLTHRAIRDRQDVIIGGISGANSNLTGQSGTIGYFCRRKSKLRRRNEIYLLSNSHVFADLRKAKVEDTDLIMQPSPGEPAGARPIGALANFSKLIFDGETTQPNFVDAALARLWSLQAHKPVIPLIGTLKGFAGKNDIELGERARKFGRTTGYTEGRVVSIYLDIWIRYDRTGQSAFFSDQYLIEPASPNFQKFVLKGDSGSLVVDERQYAIGLIFAGVSELPESAKPQSAASTQTDENPKRIEGYGVANPISEVLKHFGVELIV